MPSVEINDKDIDKVIDNIRKQNSEWSDSTKEAADDNKIVVDYEGKINGKDFKNNKQSDFSFVINDTIKGDPATVSLFKEFSLKCMGKNVNDIVEVTNKMPNDFPDKELAGKTVIYTIKIKRAGVRVSLSICVGPLARGQKLLVSSQNRHLISSLHQLSTFTI